MLGNYEQSGFRLYGEEQESHLELEPTLSHFPLQRIQRLPAEEWVLLMFTTLRLIKLPIPSWDMWCLALL